jgi:hypothetical protein
MFKFITGPSLIPLPDGYCCKRKNPDFVLAFWFALMLLPTATKRGRINTVSDSLEAFAY